MYIKLYYDIIDSNSWKACGSKAHNIYIGLLAKSCNGTEPITYSVREAAKFANCSKNTASLAFKELERNGLIKCIEGSDFHTKKVSRKWSIVEVSDID